MSPFRKKFGGLDRGRGMMGAKHCWVDDTLCLLDTKPAHRADHFQSRREAKRWIALKQEEKFGGFIRNLRRQVRFPLHATRPDGLKVKICSYVADFVYERKHPNPHLADHVGWREVVEDSKGMKTDVYKIKAAWLLIEHGITIQEV
jgi:hypothetical protein